MNYNNKPSWIKKFKVEISLILLFSFINLAIGCSYYKSTTLPNDPNLVEQLQKNRKYIILHQGSNVWHLKEISLNENSKEMNGHIEHLSVDHLHYLNTKPGPNRYHPANEDPTQEVHIYISEYVEGENSRIMIPISSITKIEVYDSAIGANTASTIFTGIGIILGLLIILSIVIVLTKSSCPLVYVNDGNVYHFEGEMYGGAIYPSLERDDYMPLPNLNLSQGERKLTITNEFLEKQYTDLAELLLIEHPDNSKVIFDKNGAIQTIINPESPTIAIADNNLDYSNQIRFKDNSAYLFNENNRENKDLSKLVLSFKKPLNTDIAKLIIRAKNTLWLDYMFGKFNEQFGIYYSQFAEKQKKVPRKNHIQWSLDQGIPLTVYLQTEIGWEYLDYFNVVGPLASRDLVMAVDVSKVKEETFKIKLECGFMFWEIDYAAIDFSKNVDVKTEHINPLSAIDEKGNDVFALIKATDHQYLLQPEVGNEVTLKYSVHSPKLENLQSCFLHSRGYYEYIRDYKGIPNLTYLYSFKKKGAFTKFSKQHYNEFINSKDFFVNALNCGNGK